MRLFRLCYNLLELKNILIIGIMLTILGGFLLYSYVADMLEIFTLCSICKVLPEREKLISSNDSKAFFWFLKSNRGNVCKNVLCLPKFLKHLILNLLISWRPLMPFTFGISNYRLALLANILLSSITSSLICDFIRRKSIRRSISDLEERITSICTKREDGSQVGAISIIFYDRY